MKLEYDKKRKPIKPGCYSKWQECGNCRSCYFSKLCRTGKKSDNVIIPNVKKDK